MADSQYEKFRRVAIEEDGAFCAAGGVSRRPLNVALPTSVDTNEQMPNVIAAVQHASKVTASGDCGSQTVKADLKSQI
jgi:hypothetical protein